MSKKIRVTIYNEYIEEKKDPAAVKLYPNGMHGTIKEFLSKNPDLEVTAVTMELPDCGLTEELLNNTDVLLWWGHGHHGDVSDEVVKRVKRRVLAGMGFIPLHSAHASKPFMALMGTTCRLHWCDDQKEIMWTVVPSHPIAKGVPEYFIIDSEEMYGEPFGIPNPDEIVFIGWFNHGNVFRAGVTFKRGNGKIFYFQPGHQSNGAYLNPSVQKIIENAVYWAKADFIPNDFDDYMAHDTIKI
jgi:trehalose utilization protein